MRPADHLLLQLFDDDGWSYHDIARERGLSVDSVRGRISRARREAEDARVLELEAKLAAAEARIIELEDEIADPYQDSARGINDVDKWAAYLQTAPTDRAIRVMFWSDAHLPDIDWQAFELALQVAAAYQPDVNVWLGDEYDFDLLSTHWPHASNRKRRDAFKEIETDWRYIHQRIKYTTPNAVNVMIGGNHTLGRVENFVNECAIPLDDTIIEAFLDIVRADGKVWWMGWIDEMWIGDLHVEHGTRTGEASAKNSLKDVGWASPRIGGHVHAPSWYINFNYEKTPDPLKKHRKLIESITAPCLCDTTPHYRAGMSKKQKAVQKRKTRWVNGVATAHVHLGTGETHLRNFIFHERIDGSMATVFGADELIQQPIAHSRRNAA